MTDATLREAVAKIIASSGADIIVHAAVPDDALQVTARVYRWPVQAILQWLINDHTGLEVREEWVTPAGVVTSQPDIYKDHVRYYIVPKSELKVSGLPTPEVPATATALASRPAPENSRNRVTASAPKVAPLLRVYPSVQPPSQPSRPGATAPNRRNRTAGVCHRQQ